MSDVVIIEVEPSVAGTNYMERVRLSFAKVKQEYKV